MKILLADDHAVLRRGLKLILTDAFPKASFGEAENCQQALAMAVGKPWDLVILDISMPGRGGLDVLKEVHAQRPKLPVLILSMHAEQQFAVRAFRLGASGYLTKDSAADELVNAVRRIQSGGRYVSAEMAEQLVSELGGGGGSDALHKQLSDREFEILRLLASCKTVKAIADELHLSVNTVRTYRARILEKMQMHTNAELVRYAIANKLVD